MRALVLKLGVLFGVAFALLCFIAWRFESGYLDPFYLRLTTPKAHSMVIGTSRAAQGMPPSVLEEELDLLGFQFPVQNFAFTVGHTPYGPKYLELIKSKVNQNTINGLFILTVDPWALSNLSESESEVSKFRENSLLHVSSTSIDPNFEYIFKDFGPLYIVLLNKYDTSMFLHKNGWLEVSVPVDSIVVQQRIEEKVKHYWKNAANGSISLVRLRSLEETINFLKGYGKLFLVRMPVSAEIATIEDVYAPNFDEMMENLAEKHSVPYLNYIESSGNYLTTDGNHLYKEAARAFSKRMASDIMVLLPEAQQLEITEKK